MQKFIPVIAFGLIVSSCNFLGNDGPKKDSSQSAGSGNTTISQVRNNPAAKPVAVYEKKVKNDLNDWHFRIALYETNQRFVYRMTMEYEAIYEEKEITFPNLNEEPKPEIRPGSKEYDAIIGFIDNKAEFKEYLNVFVQDDNLQLKTLKHYAVTSK